MRKQVNSPAQARDPVAPADHRLRVQYQQQPLITSTSFCTRGVCSRASSSSHTGRVLLQHPPSRRAQAGGWRSQAPPANCAALAAEGGDWDSRAHQGPEGQWH